MTPENQLIQAITGKPNLAETSREDWQQLLGQYPAFGIGQYLYAKKLALDADPGALAQRRLAAVHFNDLRWLDYLLTQTDTQRQDSVTEASVEKSAVSGNALPVEVIAATAPSLETQDLMMDKETAEAPVLVPEPEPDVMVSPQKTDTITGIDNDIEPGGEQQRLSAEKDMITFEDEPDNHRISSLVSAQLADFKKPVTDDIALGLKKEPLYKIDYFASQGIILGQPQDALGKKVKKFTDWLKDMKQSGQGTPQLHTTKQEEQQIIHKAAASLQAEAVFTESMAEVLLQQGKRAQAKEVYQKLSLLYPEKTTYFASKIDSLQQ